jgi:hypothetical protein
LLFSVKTHTCMWTAVVFLVCGETYVRYNGSEVCADVYSLYFIWITVAENNKLVCFSCPIQSVLAKRIYNIRSRAKYERYKDISNWRWLARSIYNVLHKSWISKRSKYFEARE